MKYIVDSIVNLIIKNINPNSLSEESMFKIDGFENVVIYEKVAERLDQYFTNNNITNNIKLARKKWELLKKDAEHTSEIQKMISNKWVSEAESVTFYRNLHNSAVLVLMGTEDEDDKGGLINFYTINPQKLIETINGNYSEVFEISTSLSEDERAIINCLFKDLYEFVPFDICKLSDIADMWENEITTISDFIQIFFKCLPLWGLPRQEDSLPSSADIRSKKNVLKEHYNFISRSMQLFSKLSQSSYKKILKKFADYEEKGKYSSSFSGWSKHCSNELLEIQKTLLDYVSCSTSKLKISDFLDCGQPFSSFNDFKCCFLKYVQGIDIEKYKQKFLWLDFAIIQDILNLKISSPINPVDKAISISGDPLTIFTNLLLRSLSEIKNSKKDIDHIKIKELSAEIVTPIINDESSLRDSWLEICLHTHGVVDFITKDRAWEINDKKIEFEIDDPDFFNPNKIRIHINNDVKPASANKSISKIKFTITFWNGTKQDKDLETEVNWNINPNSPWISEFSSLIEKTCEIGTYEEYIPLCTAQNIKSLVFAKSEDEFYDVLSESEIDFSYNLIKNKDIYNINSEICNIIVKLGHNFTSFIHYLRDNGLYKTLGTDYVIKLINSYTELGKELRKVSWSEIDKWVLDLFVHAFNIENSTDSIEKNSEIDFCVVPPWHPATLEKLNNQKVFFLDGCFEWWCSISSDNKIKQEEINSIILELSQMSKIQSSVDIFPTKSNQFFGVIASFDLYSIYSCQNIEKNTTLKDMIKKDAIYDDDFNVKNDLILTDDAKMLLNVIQDYSKAFPSSYVNLSVVFINPSELQPIVASVHEYLKLCRKKYANEKINIILKILVKPDNKGGRNYLSYWMDEYFSEDENVSIKTYLNEWKTKEDLDKILNANNDIIFVMDLLKVNSLTFLKNETSKTIGVNECLFPIVYKPTPVSKTSIKRKIELSQPQFKCSYEHTQISRYINNTENIPITDYIAAREVSIDEEAQEIVYSLHDKAFWVVCVDSGMDGALLKNTKYNDAYSIIGFSTGKGSYGQYNLTITSRKSILDIIKKKLQKRLKMLFSWDDDKIAKSTEICVKEASGLDGISLLSAINQNDYNINEFMAYVLTSLRERKTSKTSALKIIVHLDSYKHWFSSDIEKDEDGSNSRPDFLVLEVNETSSDCLNLLATVVECKISPEENYIEKALEQVKHGIKRLSKIFDPESKSVKRRYWYAQLYRALAFAQVTFSDNSSEFVKISMQLRKILDGKFNIKWGGKVFGFWFDKDGVEDEVKEVDEIKIYNIPQQSIQNTLSNETDNKFVKIIDSAGIKDDKDETIVPNDSKIEDKPISEPAQDDSKVENKPISEPAYDDSKTEDNTLSKINSPKEADIKEEVKLDDIRVLLGKDKTGKEIFWEFGNRSLANRHLLITGTSGYGKTYGIQTLLYELSKFNISSVIFDYTEGFMPTMLEKEFKEKMEDRMEQLVVYYTGVPINPFSKHLISIPGMEPMVEKDSDIATRFASIVSHVYKFGEQQYSAVYQAVKNGLMKYKEKMNMKYFETELDSIGTSYSKSVMSKMLPFMDSVTFNDDLDFKWDEIIYPKNSKTTIFQLTSLSREMQVIVTELLLWDLWYFSKKNGNKDKPFTVVLDEAQNLSHKDDSPSKAILTEGRKFGWSAWFATQSLNVLDDNEVTRLSQAAFKLFFKPTEEEISKIAKLIDVSDYSSWISPIKSLKKGTCIVLGDRINQDGVLGPAKPIVTNILPFSERK